LLKSDEEYSRKNNIPFDKEEARRERERTNLEQEITNLENKPDKTLEEEEELDNLKNKLKDLDGKSEEETLPKKKKESNEDNFPSIIGLLVLIIGLPLSFLFW